MIVINFLDPNFWGGVAFTIFVETALLLGTIIYKASREQGGRK